MRTHTRTHAHTHTAARARPRSHMHTQHTHTHRRARNHARAQQAGHGTYRRMDAALLPQLYLVYTAKVHARSSAQQRRSAARTARRSPTQAGGESGKIHNNVRARWESGDAAARGAMVEFASFAESLRELADAPAQRLDVQRLGALMTANFGLRRQLYGDATLGAINIRMIELAKELGFAAKFTGSGGAVVLLHTRSDGQLSEADEVDVASRFASEDFVFSRIRVKLPEEQSILDH